MNRRMSRVGLLGAALTLFAVLTPRIAAAQAPAAPATPSPGDVPSIRVGATLFANYNYQTEPEIADSDGNLVNRNSFDVARSYINVTGSLNHIIAFRVTPDILRETNTASSLNGSLVFRIKYAYLQTNLDDWMTRGSWARFGVHQTPYMEFIENIYRYRFQGTLLVERAGYMSSADAGVSFHYNYPGDYGDVHVGIYNGEGYGRAEPNDQKGLLMRVTGRPFPKAAPALRGLRGHFYHYGDHHVKDGERRRTIGTATYEHPSVVAGFEYIDARDQRSALPGQTAVDSRGYSVWATPRTRWGWEGLLRYDHHVPNTSTALAPFSTAGNFTTTLDSQQQNRVIVGVAYWFKLPSPGTAALLVDYDAQVFENLTALPTKTLFVHGLINF